MMSGGPDFIVDPAGNVRDVRHLKNAPSAGYASSSSSTTDNLANNFYSGKSVQVSTPPARRGNYNSYLIPIPIGLIITLILLALRALSGSPQSTGISQTDLSMWQGANMDLVAGRYDMALINLAIVIKDEPQFDGGYNSRGLVYQAQGKHAQALKDFSRAIELNPKSAPAYNNRSMSYLAQEQYDLALSDLNTALQLEPHLAKAYLNRGMTYYALGNLDSALNDINQAIQYTPEGTSLHRRATPDTTPTWLDDSEDYFKLYQSAADLPTAYYLRAIVYVAQGQIELARQDLAKASALDPDTELQLKIDYLLQSLENDWLGPSG